MVIAFVATLVAFVIGAILIIGEAAKLVPIFIAVAMLFICGLQDVKNKTITIGVVIVAIAAAAVFTAVKYSPALLLRQFVIAAGILLFLLLAYKLTKKGLGLGDIFVLTSLVFILGHVITFIILGLASIIFIIYFFATKKGNEKKETAFIPFLYFASLPILLLV